MRTARIAVSHHVNFQKTIGGAEGNRTPDLLNAIQALSQLSYGPTWIIAAITVAISSHLSGRRPYSQTPEPPQDHL